MTPVEPMETGSSSPGKVSPVPSPTGNSAVAASEEETKTIPIPPRTEAEGVTSLEGAVGGSNSLKPTSDPKLIPSVEVNEDSLWIVK